LSIERADVSAVAIRASAALPVYAFIVIVAPLVVLAVVALLAFDACVLILIADLAVLAVAVLLAFDAFVVLTSLVVLAIFIFRAFDALVTIADVIAIAVVVVFAFGQRALAQRGEPYQTECATGGSLEQAATIGRRSHDAGDGIKSIGVHHGLLFA
jgi:hypothetical protein